MIIPRGGKTRSEILEIEYQGDNAMLLIIGLNTPKLVGLNQQDQPAIFGPENAANFHAPDNLDAYRACVFEALRFYEYLSTNRPEEIAAPFGVMPTTQGLIRNLAKDGNLVLALTSAFEAPKILKHIKTCKHCGQPFLATSWWQETCHKRECQLKRLAANNRAAYGRKTKEAEQ
jgi:hypothetical protein